MAIRADIEKAVAAVIPTLPDEYVPETKADANGHLWTYQKNRIRSGGVVDWYAIARYTSNADYVQCYPGRSGWIGGEGPVGEWGIEERVKRD